MMMTVKIETMRWILMSTSSKLTAYHRIRPPDPHLLHLFKYRHHQHPPQVLTPLLSTLLLPLLLSACPKLSSISVPLAPAAYTPAENRPVHTSHDDQQPLHHPSQPLADTVAVLCKLTVRILPLLR